MYTISSDSESRPCPVITPVSFELHSPGELLFGSAPPDSVCDAITIEGVAGVDPCHAKLIWNPNEWAWYLVDDPAPGKTYLNGDPVDGRRRLHEGDEIGIAGVRFRFSRKSDNAWVVAEIKGKTNEGVRIDVKGLTAEIEDDDGDCESKTKTLLNDVSFHVEPNSFTAILGPSGCGKSTLIQRLAGFPLKGRLKGSISLDENYILRDGNPVPTDKSDSKCVVAYLPQTVEDMIYDDMSVAATMENFAQCHLAKECNRDFFIAALDAVGLQWKGIALKPVKKLSGGQKRRLALALELMRKPRLLLLDEPTAGLDPAAEAKIMELLRTISGRGMTILCATHVLGSLDKCRKVLVLAKRGRVEFHGTPNEALVAFSDGNEAHPANNTDCAKNWLGVYRKLANENECDKPHSTPSAQSKAHKSASFGGAIFATLRRLGHSIFAPTKFMLFAGVPFVVSLLLLWACGNMLDNREVGTFYFCMTVAMFWFGLTGSFRSLVSERIPKRCLDRMRGIPLWRYFSAHAAFAFIYSFAQSLLFVLPIFLFRLGYGPEFTFYACPEVWFDLGLVGFSGGCVGLAVSAWVKKELYAALLLPLVAIPVLFMSKPVLESGFDSKPRGVLRVIECNKPTLYPQTVLETTMERAKVYHVMPDPRDLDGISLEDAQHRSVENWEHRPEKRDETTGEVVRGTNGGAVFGESWADKHASNVFRFISLMMRYAIFWLILAFLGQYHRERQWDGR